MTDERPADWPSDDAEGWVDYTPFGERWFPLYGASGGLNGKEISYRVFKPKECIPEGADLGITDSKYVRVKIRTLEEGDEERRRQPQHVCAPDCPACRYRALAGGLVGTRR